MEIRRISEDDRTGEFINVEFSDYATDCEVALNYEEFCFAAEEDGEIAGVITGRAYYNEVHIGDLIVEKNTGETELAVSWLPLWKRPIKEKAMKK